MKRKLIGLLTCIMFTLLATSPCLASNGQESVENEVVYEKKEIKDLNKLFDKAIKGETDLELPAASDGKLINKKTGEQKTFKTYKTTQLLKVEKNKKGNLKKKYVTTAFTIFKLDDSDDNIVSTQEEEGVFGNPAEWDSTGHVRVWSKFYFVYGETDNGVQTVLVTRVEGGWDVYDNQYDIQNRHVQITCNGYMEGRISVSDQIEDKYPDWLDFHYYAPNDWDHVMTTLAYQVGNVVECEVYRGSEHWYLEHDNVTKNYF